MPFYNHNRNTRRARPGAALPSQPDYGYRQSGIRRHEAVFGIKNTTSLPPGEYLELKHLRFRRTFDAVDPDVEPIPTSGNNYNTVDVMNGSRIMNFREKTVIRNNQQTDAAAATQKTITLQVYELVYSFWDAYIFDQHDTAAGLTSGVIDFTGSGDNAGEVDFEATQPPISANLIKNSKFLQRYLRPVGELTIAPGEQIELNINRVPPKCRRSNSGMFWAHILVNDTIKNHGENIVISAVQEVSFEEIPSTERLPFLY